MKRRLVVAALVVLALLWLWRRHATREAQWSLSIDGDTKTAMPWQGVTLAAKILPGDVDVRGWTWRWDSDGVALDHHLEHVQWRSGAKGMHRVTVTATSASGTSRSASTTIVVTGVDHVTSGIPGRPPVPEEPTPADKPWGFTDVWVEKSSVCRGEPSRIRATPYFKDGELGHLRGATAAQPGFAAVFQQNQATPGVQRIPITVWDQAAGFEERVTTYVYIEVKDCVAPRTIYVAATNVTTPEGREVGRFDAHLMDGPRSEEEGRWATDDKRARHVESAAAFRWTFGDGTTEVVETPGAFSTIQHAYPDEEDRPIDDFTTHYSVGVEALDASGAVLAQGYTGIQFINLMHQLRAQTGTIHLVTTYDLEPQVAQNGVKWLAITARNPDPEETAQLSDLELTLTTCDGHVIEGEVIPASTVFPDHPSIPPKTAITGKWTWSDKRPLCFVTARITGTTTPAGLLVNGSLAMTVGIRPDRQKVVDPVRLSELQTAMKLLDKNVVTDADLKQLRAQGKLPPEPPTQP